ncbi:MAG: DUF4157 domain-containing protein [Myxococcales bacterium]|nr:DUF4157 domain-containing protein [Myxococcales bacterium]
MRSDSPVDRIATATASRFAADGATASADHLNAALRSGTLQRGHMPLVEAWSSHPAASSRVADSTGAERPSGAEVIALRKSADETGRSETVTTSELEALGSGQRLSDAMQERLSEQLAAAGVHIDLRHIRVHAGAAADALCRSVGANAFASGHHIAFRSGLYQPSTREGLALLAHELTHVAQFERGAVSVAATSEQPIVDSPSLEAAADRVAADVVSRPEPIASAEEPFAVAPSVEPTSDFGALQLDEAAAQAEAGVAAASAPSHQFVALPGGHRLSSAIHANFVAACAEIQTLTGADLTQGVGDSTRNLANATTKVGADNFSWHKTGRAVDLNQGLRWVIREDASGGSTFFRLYLARLATPTAEAGAAPAVAPPDAGAAAAQDDAAVAPDPTSVRLPEGTEFHHNPYGRRVYTTTFVDVTAILEKHGLERIRAQNGWEDSYNRREWWHYQKTEGLTWYDALLQVYAQAELVRLLTSLKRNAGIETFPARLGVPNPLPTVP